jgi:hypothetical protein
MRAHPGVFRPRRLALNGMILWPLQLQRNPTGFSL